MAKISKDEARVEWAEAEARYREVAERYFAGDDAETLDKDAVVAVSKARAKADKRMAVYFKRVLD